MGQFHRHPAHPHPVDINRRPVVLHVTVCTQDKRPILANHEAIGALKACWPAATQWSVGYFLVMPDHIHFFCAPSRIDAEPVQRWCGYWKRLTGVMLPALHGAFQRNCWDTQMRDGEHYRRKLEYVAGNPVRAGLVEDPSDWVFQGAINKLPWIS